MANDAVIFWFRMKWEYKMYSCDRPFSRWSGRAGELPADEMTAALNTLGNEGWEAVSVFPVETASQTNSVGILLKRAVPE